jgi:general stress protein YciG
MTESNESTQSTTTPTVDEAPAAPARKPRGFAALTPEKRREISSKGGISAHAKGVGHQFTAEEARAAGAKGGRKAAENHARMVENAKLGGAARRAKAEAEAKK